MYQYLPLTVVIRYIYILNTLYIYILYKYVLIYYYYDLLKRRRGEGFIMRKTLLRFDEWLYNIAKDDNSSNNFCKHNDISFLL